MNKDRIINLFQLFSAAILCHTYFWFSTIEITKLCNAMYVTYNGIMDANCSSFFSTNVCLSSTYNHRRVRVISENSKRKKLYLLLQKSINVQYIY